MSRIEHFQAGSYDSGMVRTFLAVASSAYPQEVGSPDFDVWPDKVAARAECFCVRSSNGAVCAALFAYLNAFQTRVAYIPFICALPECEKGMAYRLHESMLKRAREVGMQKVRLEVLKTNVHAMEFYGRQGYVVVEKRPERNRMLMEFQVASF